MAKIALTMIARDEAATIRACLESLAPHVDELIIVDTGSVDDTVAIASEFTDKVVKFEWVDDFAAARQFALDQVSDDVDWIAWADADDVVEGAEKWRDMAAKAPAGVQGFIFPYNYQIDPATGTCTTRLYRERLLRGPASRWEWTGAVHEVLGLKDKTTPHLVVTDECVYVHNRPEQKYLPDRNLRIIQRYIADADAKGETPDPRMVTYLGSELMAHGRWAEAIPAFNRYIAMSNWTEEKFQAHHKLADCYRQMGMFHESIATELKGLSLRDDWADSYYGLAESYYHLQDWDKCISWTARGDEVGPPQTLLITHPLDYTFLPKVFLSVALFHKGQIEEALDVIEQALAIMPNDVKLQHNREVFAENLRSKRTVEAALLLSSELVVHDEPLMAAEVLDRLPHTLRFDPRIIDARAKTRRLMGHAWTPEGYIDFYAGSERQPRASFDSDVDPTRFPRYAALLKDLERWDIPPEGLTILEVGCNDGVMAVDLARRGHMVTAVDLNPAALDVARARAEHFGVADRIEFVEGDITEVFEWDFDVAFAFEVVEHVPDHIAFLRQLDEKARMGGLVAVSTPDGVYDRDYVTSLGISPEHREHLRVLPRHELTDLIYELNLGVIRSNQRTEDRLAYVSWDRIGFPNGRDISIWCPFGYEPWSPESLDTGIGGSEEAVIHMARELTAAGNRVTVYGGAEGAWDGVLYHNYAHFDPWQPRDVVIVWRTPTPVDFDLAAKQVYVWMHDVPNPAEFTPERLARINKVWVLSEWHRACLPAIPDDKIEVIRNGVTVPEQTTSDERDPLKVVWASSPDRGLDKLMAVWSDVAAAVPGATLHCYYGFDMYDRMGRPPGFKQQVMGLVEQNKDTVTWHGRVGQQELWDAFATAGVWAYPTYFDEISCITAMRSQRAGAWPVVVPQAALAETVRWGDKVDYDINTPEGLEAFRDALIGALRQPIPEDGRRRMMKDANETFTWTAVAKMWLDRFEADRS